MATTVKTNKQDYAPGQTVSITAEGFGEMAGIRFQVVNLGADGLLGTQDDLIYPSWTVASAFPSAFDNNGGPLPGRIDTTWVVPQSALNSSLVLTAEAIFSGEDRQLGTADDVATGESATTAFTDSANPAPVQLFYVPFPEDQLLAGLQAITGDTAPTNPMQTYVSIAASSNDTIIYYDQWENGYDLDIANPSDLYSAANLGGTQIWGDGNISNGAAPGVTTNAGDVIKAGQVIVLNNPVTTTNLTAIDFDGRDKIAATKTVALTHVGWASGSNTLLAGAVEVFDTKSWGTEYRVPVGANIPDATDFQMFSYTGLYIMAGEGGATISVDVNADGDFLDAGDANGVILTEGQPYFVNGGVNVGARVTSDKPVQVDFLTGDIGSTYESRDSALLPTSLWSSDYYTPVSTNTTNAGTTVWLYNPASSAITVVYEHRTSATTIATANITVPGGVAGGYTKQIIPDVYGAHFYTQDPDGAGTQLAPKFYAFSTTDSTDSTSSSGSYGGNQAWDWGFTLVPKESLTPQVLVGLGIGRDPTSGTSLTQNGNPIWVTPVGNGNTAATIYIDYDADPLTGANTDPNGNKYDTSVSLRELERAKVYDTTDGNQTGMLIYTLTPGVTLAAAWGQDPLTASAGAPGLDVGTGLVPLPLFSAGKNGTLSIDNDANGVVSAGDELLYTINISNTSRAPVPNLLLTDNLPVDTTYVANSTFFKNAAGVVTAIPDDGTGTAFPLDGLGRILDSVNPLPVGGTYQVTFKVLIDGFGDLTPGTTQIVNTGTASAVGVTIPIQSTTPLIFVSIEKQVSADGSTWFDADDPTGPVIPVGQPVYFRVAVTNSGGLPATVDLTDTILLGSDAPRDFKFGGSQSTTVAAGATVYTDTISDTALLGQNEDRVFASVTVTDGTTTSTVTVAPDDANYFGASGAVTIEKQVSATGLAGSWLDADSPDGPTILVGENVYYRVAVTNNGNVAATVDLSDVTLVGTDPAHNFTFGVGNNQTTTVAVGATAYTNVIADIATAGPHRDQASATAQAGAITLTVAPDDANYFGGVGAVSIEKQVSADGTNWTDADDPTGPVIAAGQNVYFRVAVTNNSTGGLTATVDLTDTILVGSDSPHDFKFGGAQSTTVAAGATVFSDVITDTALAGQNEDQASATATVTDGVNTTPVTVTPDDANYFGAAGAVVIEKQVSADGTNWFDADDPTGPVIAVGQSVYFRVAVTNNSTGGLAATVDLTDTILVGSDTAHDFTFGGNQSTTVAAGATVFSDVITDTALAGQNEDQASATATVTDGVNTTAVTVAPDDANYFGAAGAVVIEKQVSADGTNWFDADDPTGPVIAAGQNVYFRVAVTNNSTGGL
ncbi:MAG: DUF11 domain-containing protein, partial [Candidatus Accumulibacter sp.]|nr:DUF11 domain-containing protein [Candidatus Accumulibacter conexus]